MATFETRFPLSIRPNVQTFLSGSGAYTTPTGAKWLSVRMVGGGGGGGGGGAIVSNNGTAGVASTFGSSLLTATAGLGCINEAGGVGGTPTIASPATGIAIKGGSGNGAAYSHNTSLYMHGQMGGSSALGGNGGGGGVNNNNATAGSPNTGGGGGGGSSGVGTTLYGGSGGGAGGYIDAVISSPAASYAYAVGTGGAGGAAGASGFVGGAGGSGVIIVTAYFS